MKKFFVIIILLFASCAEKNINGKVYKKYITPQFICVDTVSCARGGGVCGYYYLQHKDEYVIKVADDITNTIRKFYIPKDYYENLEIGDVVSCNACVNFTYKIQRKAYREDIYEVDYEKMLKKYGKCNYRDKDEL